MPAQWSVEQDSQFSLEIPLASKPYASSHSPVNSGKIAPHILEKAQIAFPLLWFAGDETADNSPEKIVGGMVSEGLARRGFLFESVDDSFGIFFWNSVVTVPARCIRRLEKEGWRSKLTDPITHLLAMVCLSKCSGSVRASLCVLELDGEPVRPVRRPGRMNKDAALDDVLGRDAECRNFICPGQGRKGTCYCQEK